MRRRAFPAVIDATAAFCRFCALLVFVLAMAGARDSDLPRAGDFEALAALSGDASVLVHVAAPSLQPKKGDAPTRWLPKAVLATAVALPAERPQSVVPAFGASSPEVARPAARPASQGPPLTA